MISFSWNYIACQLDCFLFVSNYSFAFWLSFPVFYKPNLFVRLACSHDFLISFQGQHLFIQIFWTTPFLYYFTKQYFVRPSRFCIFFQLLWGWLHQDYRSSMDLVVAIPWLYNFYLFLCFSGLLSPSIFVMLAYWCPPCGNT